MALLLQNALFAFQDSFWKETPAQLLAQQINTEIQLRKNAWTATPFAKAALDQVLRSAMTANLDTR